MEVCFRIWLQEWGEITKDNQLIQVLVCRPNKWNSENRGFCCLGGMLRFVGWVVPDILKDCDAFIFSIKNALRSFETSETTNHNPEDLSFQNIFRLSRILRSKGKHLSHRFLPYLRYPYTRVSSFHYIFLYRKRFCDDKILVQGLQQLVGKELCREYRVAANAG